MRGKLEKLLRKIKNLFIKKKKNMIINMDQDFISDCS